MTNENLEWFRGMRETSTRLFASLLRKKLDIAKRAAQTSAILGLSMGAGVASVELFRAANALPPEPEFIFTAFSMGSLIILSEIAKRGFFRRSVPETSPN